jgi:hypothetical protein
MLVRRIGWRGDRAVAIYSLVVSARLNNVDPRAWLADMLRHIADLPAKDLLELLPWNPKKKANAVA